MKISISKQTRQKITKRAYKHFEELHKNVSGDDFLVIPKMRTKNPKIPQLIDTGVMRQIFHYGGKHIIDEVINHIRKQLKGKIKQ